MEKEMFSEKKLQLENGDNIILHYFITKTTKGYEEGKEQIYGVEIAKHCDNLLVESENVYGITDNHAYIVYLANKISEHYVMPSSLLNVVDDFTL